MTSTSLLTSLSLLQTSAADVDVDDDDALPTSVKEAIFSIEIELSSGRSLTFSPQLRDFQSALESIIYAAVNAVMKYDRLIEDEELQQFTQVNVDDGGEELNDAHAETFVLQDEEFQEFIHNIKRSMYVDAR